MPPGSIIKSRKGRKNNTNWIFIMCQGGVWDLSQVLLICIIDRAVCIRKPVVLCSVSMSQGLVLVEFSLIKYLPPSIPLILPFNLGDPPVYLVCLAFTTAILPAFLFCPDSNPRSFLTVNPGSNPTLKPVLSEMYLCPRMLMLTSQRGPTCDKNQISNIPTLF